MRQSVLAATILVATKHEGGNVVAIAMLVDNPEGSQEIYDKVIAELDVNEKPVGQQVISPKS